MFFRRQSDTASSSRPTIATDLSSVTVEIIPVTTLDSYWNAQWNKVNPHGYYDYEKQAMNALELLAQYACFYKQLFGFGMAWGGSIGRFFSGNWSRQHGDAVQAAIGNYFHMDGYLAHCEEYHTPEYVLARVKQSIGRVAINPSDDLAKIIKVIEHYTGVNYATLSITDIDQYKATEARRDAAIERKSIAMENMIETEYPSSSAARTTP